MPMNTRNLTIAVVSAVTLVVVLVTIGILFMVGTIRIGGGDDDKNKTTTVAPKKSAEPSTVDYGTILEIPASRKPIVSDSDSGQCYRLSTKEFDGKIINLTIWDTTNKVSTEVSKNKRPLVLDWEKWSVGLSTYDGSVDEAVVFYLRNSSFDASYERNKLSYTVWKDFFSFSMTRKFGSISAKLSHKNNTFWVKNATNEFGGEIGEGVNNVKPNFYGDQFTGGADIQYLDPTGYSVKSVLADNHTSTEIFMTADWMKFKSPLAYIHAKRSYKSDGKFISVPWLKSKNLKVFANRWAAVGVVANSTKRFISLPGYDDSKDSSGPLQILIDRDAGRVDATRGCSRVFFRAQDGQLGWREGASSLNATVKMIELKSNFMKMQAYGGKIKCDNRNNKLTVNGDGCQGENDYASFEYRPRKGKITLDRDGLKIDVDIIAGKIRIGDKEIRGNWTSGHEFITVTGKNVSIEYSALYIRIDQNRQYLSSNVGAVEWGSADSSGGKPLKVNCMAGTANSMLNDDLSFSTITVENKLDVRATFTRDRNHRDFIFVKSPLMSMASTRSELFSMEPYSASIILS